MQTGSLYQPGKSLPYLFIYFLLGGLELTFEFIYEIMIMMAKDYVF